MGVIHSLLGQCENGTSTNPQSPSPNNAGFKTNTFDWRQNPIPVTDKHKMDSPLPNPFFSIEPYLQPLHGGVNSDSKPEDGWELIKQDFGYAEANGFWNGTTIFNRTSSNKQEIAYMMLYNRYTTTLRIISNVDLSQNGNRAQVIVALSVMEKDEAANHANFNFAALFNQYNAVQTALDQKTKLSTVMTIAQIQPSRSSFTFADFKLSYDPCICFFESAFFASFFVNLGSTLTLEGQAVGGSVDIAAKNARPGNDFLTSLWKNASSEPFFNQSFYSEEKLKEQLATTAAPDGKTKQQIDSIFSKFRQAAQSAKISKEVPIATVHKLAHSLGTYLEFASFTTDPSKPNSEIQNLTVIPVGVTTQGNVSTLRLNGQEIFVSVPGSKNSTLLPEYPVSLPPSKGIQPMYPMYNEIPGHFALLRTPMLHYNYEQWTDGTDRNITFIAKLPDNQDLLYALGSLVNADKTQIFVGIEVQTGRGQKYVSAFLPLRLSKNLYAIVKTPRAFTASDLGAGIGFKGTDIKLVFQIFYDFKSDATGNSKTGYDLIKMKVNPVLDKTQQYLQDPRYKLYAQTPTNLGIANTPLNDNPIFSFGDINITANISHTGATPLVIMAQGDVNLAPNVQVTGNVQIRSNQLFPPWITPVYAPTPPMTLAAIQDFCQKSDYKANQLLLPLPPPPISQRLLSSSLQVSPNPFKEGIRVQFEVVESGNIQIWLVNGLGQVIQTVINTELQKGFYEELLFTSELANGFYYIMMQSKQGVQSKKIVKQ
jgi:hypothetical protein